MKPIHVMLVDDQPLFTDSLRIVIEKSGFGDISIVGVAHSGEEAIIMAQKTQPDVIIMDVKMPNVDGIEATRIIKRQQPEVRVIVLTTYDDDEYVCEAVKYGASGYLLKDVNADDLLASVRSVARNTMLISPSIIKKLLREQQGSEMIRAEDQHVAELIESLSARERQVLSCIAKVMTNTEIADSLYIAEQTVRNHVYNIYNKLDIHDRLQLIQCIKRSRVNLP